MTLKIYKGSDTYFQSNVSGFFMNSNGKLSMTVNNDSYEVDCDGITFWSIYDDWQDDEKYRGLIPIK